MRLSGITYESFVDGPGIRLVLFTQGCPHQCPHCHNPESWDMHTGTYFSVRQVVRILRQRMKKIRGVTFSGGEPFLQAAELAETARSAHQLGLDTVTYTGFTYERLLESEVPFAQDLLAESDLLVDGPYIHTQRNLQLPFRGSANQRLIDLSATRKEGQLVLWAANHTAIAR